MLQEKHTTYTLAAMISANWFCLEHADSLIEVWYENMALDGVYGATRITKFQKHVKLPEWEKRLRRFGLDRDVMVK